MSLIDELVPLLKVSAAWTPGFRRGCAERILEPSDGCGAISSGAASLQGVES